MWENWYKLEGKTPVPCTGMEDAGLVMGGDRSVGDTTEGEVRVSTVFLGLDHRHSYDGEGEQLPILFETMIFGGPHDQEYCERYCTWDEAAAGHVKACQEAFGHGPAKDSTTGNKSFVESVVDFILEGADEIV